MAGILTYRNDLPSVLLAHCAYPRKAQPAGDSIHECPRVACASCGSSYLLEIVIEPC